MKKKFVFTLPILFIFICLIPQISYAQETSFIAKKGILDLTTAEDSQHILSGEWEFYWNELLTPEDIIEQTAPKTYADVPNQWHNLNVEGERLDRFGYATYRLTILFPEKEIGTIKALSIPNIASSYKVWINGELIGKVGKVGTSEITSEPTNVSSILSFIPHEEATELVIQVSNFAQRKSGIWSNIELGNHQDILNSEIQYLIITGIIVGGLFIIGIYHFVMFTFRRKEKISVFLENIVKIRTEEIVVINNQLQNALDARIELISTISHEMRSPLTTIKSYAKGMIDKIIKDDNHQYTQTIYEETNFMERMLDDLFELSLLELGQYKFYYENVEPIAYFKKLFEKYQYEVAQSGLQFHFYVQENESVEIKIDPIRMEQVFINLLRNALKNTEKGSISIEVSCESSFVSFSIIDTGYGVQPELLPIIFTKFIKADNNRNIKSTGIGLSICKEIVKTHGGDITVTSRVGEGSQFTVIIPICDSLVTDKEQHLVLGHN